MALSTSWADGQPVHGSDINTISAAVNAAATLTGTETLTNKTLTSPKISNNYDPTNSSLVAG